VSEFNHGDSENTCDNDSMAHDPSMRSCPLPANDPCYCLRHKKKREQEREINNATANYSKNLNSR